MTDFSKILSGQSKNEIKPQIHDRRTALSQSFPFILVARLVIVPPYESNGQRAETGICCGLSSVRSEVRFADLSGLMPSAGLCRVPPVSGSGAATESWVCSA